MLNPKIAILLCVFIFMLGCSTDPLIIDSNTIGIKEGKINKSKNNNMINQKLEELVKDSVLIITGEVIETKLIVDAKSLAKELKSKEMESLPKYQKFVKGHLYEVKVCKNIYNKNENAESEVISIYSYGNPYALHSSVIQLTEKSEYLIFLKPLKEKEISEEFEISSPTSLETTIKLDFKKTFIINRQSHGAIKLDDVQGVVEEVENIVKLIKEEKKERN